MSKISNIKQEIQEMAVGNCISFPEEYAQDNQLEAKVHSLARGYWDSRRDKEVKRDEKLGINLDDYTKWTREALEQFMKENGGSQN